MKIDIWSDFACPFCYIGKRKLESALKKFDGTGDIEINYRSFQLDPDAKKNTNADVIQSLATKYGMPKEKAQQMVDQMIGMAKDVGLDYDYKNIIETNTFDAHRLTHYAKKFNKDYEISERLLKAHFIEALDIGDFIILSNLAEEVGLNKKDVVDMLNSDKYFSEVKSDIQTAGKLGISSVPFFIFNDKHGLSGAQSTQAFLEALREAQGD